MLARAELRVVARWLQLGALLVSAGAAAAPRWSGLTKAYRQQRDHDRYTALHGLRVRGYATTLAAGLQLDREETRVLAASAHMHDIGKSRTPLRILNKPGKLTSGEITVMGQHTIEGRTMLRELLEPSELRLHFEEAVLYHHEKWDGTGAFKLRGSAIPLNARIIAVADAFDAMTSQRSYNQPLSRPAALARLKEGAGTHFDPHLVKIFVEQLERESARSPQVPTATSLSH